MNNLKAEPLGILLIKKILKNADFGGVFELPAGQVVLSCGKHFQHLKTLVLIKRTDALFILH
jgi:hypothetical protein